MILASTYRREVCGPKAPDFLVTKGTILTPMESNSYMLRLDLGPILTGLFPIKFQSLHVRIGLFGVKIGTFSNSCMQGLETLGAKIGKRC